MAAVHDPSQPPRGLTQLTRPWSVGAEAVIRPTTEGVLYLKVNEFSGDRADNRGGLTVRIGPQPEGDREP